MVFICLKEYYQKTSHEKEVNYSFFEELNYFPFIVDAAFQIVKINKANKEAKDRNDAEKEKSPPVNKLRLNKKLPVNKPMQKKQP